MSVVKNLPGIGPRHRDGQFYLLPDGSRVPELPAGTPPPGYVDVIGVMEDHEGTPGRVIRVFAPWGAQTWLQPNAPRRLAREAAMRFWEYSGDLRPDPAVTTNVGRRWDFHLPA